jgi:hypothetical protein
MIKITINNNNSNNNKIKEPAVASSWVAAASS